MQLVIVLLVFVSIILLTLPKEVFHSRNMYKKLIRQNVGYGGKSEKLENNALDLFVRLSGIIGRFIPVRISEDKIQKINQELTYIGANGMITPKEYVGTKYTVALLCFLYFAFYYASNPDITMMLLLLTATMMGYFIPDNILHGKVRKRRETMEREVPAILSSLAITTDAGLNLMQAIEEVTVRNKGEMAKELKKTLEEMKIGISQKQAFERMAERCNIDEISYFTSSLIQALEKGNSGITLLLRDQARESWNKRKERAKELAEKASIKLFMPLLLLVFPAFAIFLLAPMLFSFMELMSGK